MRRRLFLSPSACSTKGFFAEKCLSYPAQLSVKRDCQGGSPVPLDRILVPFVRTKGTPRRRAVPVLHPAKSMPRRQAPTDSSQNLFPRPSMHGPRKNRPTVFPLLRGRAPEFAGIRAEHLSDHGKSGKSPAVSGERFCWTGPVRPL